MALRISARGARENFLSTTPIFGLLGLTLRKIRCDAIKCRSGAKEINVVEVIRLKQEIAYLRSYHFKTLAPLGALILMVLASLQIVLFGGDGVGWDEAPQKNGAFLSNFFIFEDILGGEKEQETALYCYPQC